MGTLTPADWAVNKGIWTSRRRAALLRCATLAAVVTGSIGPGASTAAGWQGSFYPADLKSADYLTFYATQFDTVEMEFDALLAARLAAQVST
jgi:hypothetical protein